MTMDKKKTEAYFRVEVSKLRPWMSYCPIYDSR